jgi:HlyD family secretion protein
MSTTYVAKRFKYVPAFKRWMIPVLAVAVLVLAFSFFRRRAAEPVGAVTYEFGQVTRGDVVNSVTASGVVQPWKTVDIKSNVSGRIVKLDVDLGDRVKAGQPIMTIDPTDPRTALEQARADLDAAQARKSRAELNWTQERAQAEARVNSARRAIESARARLAEAEANNVAQPTLTQSSINQAQATLQASRKALAQARQSKAQLQDQLKQLREVTIPLNLETVQSAANEAKANLDSAQANYKRQSDLLQKGYVAKGDVETANAQLASSQAAYRTAAQRQQTIKRENELAVSQLNAQINEAQSRIEQSEAQVRQAQAALKTANANTFQNQVRGHEVAAARAAVKQAQSDLASAIAQRNQVAVRQKEVTAANSTIVRGQAAVSQATTNLGYTRIVAPRSGVIISKKVEEGTVVPSSRGSIGSTDALVQIGDTSRLWVVCKVDETDIGSVHVGQKVNVRIDAYPSMPVVGKVIRIDPQAVVEQNVTQIPVTVQIQMTDERFKPLMNAECDFIIGEAKNVLTVPNEALKERDGKYTVQKLVNNKPKDIPVQIGVAGEDATEIKSGLKEGETVITRVNEPEGFETNNPFNQFGGRRGGGKAGGRGGQGGGRGGGGQGGGARGGARGGGGRGG